MVGFIADEVKAGPFNRSKKNRDVAIANEHLKEQAQEAENLQHFLPQHGKPWYKVPSLFKLNALILIISITSTNSGYDSSLLNAFQSLESWQTAMGFPTGAVLGAIANGVVFGVVLSTMGFTSFFADKYGRRHTISIGNIIMIIGTIIQSCAGAWSNESAEAADPDKKAYAMFLVARIILGFGSGLASVSSPPLIAELSYPTHRIATTAFFNSNWYLGAIVSAWVTYGTRTINNSWSWRIPSIIQGFFPIIQLFLIYLVPESPRYLVSKGKNAEARAILLEFHGAGDESIGGALVDFEMSEIELAIEQEKYANNFSYASLFKTPGNRLRIYIVFVIGVCMQLSGNGLVSYYLSKVLNSIGITSTSQQLVFNGGLMIYNYGISIIINLFAFQYFKRRTAFLTSITAMLITYVLWTILSAINQQRNFEDKTLGKGVMAMIFFYYIAYNFGLNGLPFVYMTEILPFTIRAKGLNISFLVQTTVSIYNGFVNPIAMDAIEWKYYIVFCCILTVELIVVYLSFVETSGRTLEEVAEVFGENISDHDITRMKSKTSVEHVENDDSSSSGPKHDEKLLV